MFLEPRVDAVEHRVRHEIQIGIHLFLRPHGDLVLVDQLGDRQAGPVAGAQQLHGLAERMGKGEWGSVLLHPIQGAHLRDLGVVVGLLHDEPATDRVVGAA